MADQVARRVARFNSHEEAEEADAEYYASLTPLERLEILLELNRRWSPDGDAEAAGAIARVCRVIRSSPG